MTDKGRQAGVATRAQGKRRHIIETACELLVDNPAATMAEIASAAGVVRRTLYGHFANRDELLSGIVDYANECVADSVARVRLDGVVLDAAADLSVAMWTVGDQFRLLVGLAGVDPELPSMNHNLAPVWAAAEQIIERGQRTRVFSSHLAAPSLARVTTAIMMGLLTARVEGAFEHPQPALAATRACLIAAGVPEDAAHAAAVGGVARVAAGT